MSPSDEKRLSTADDRLAGIDHEQDGELVAALIKLGVEPEAATDYVRRGDPDAGVFDAVLLPERLERTVTPASIAADGGLQAEDIAELMEAFGLPRPGPEDPTFTPEEARALLELGQLEDVWPREVRTQVSRAYGAMLAGIARAELQAFQLHTEPHVRALGGNTVGQLDALKSIVERLLPLADPLLVGVHRRWVEHELAQRAVSAAELRTNRHPLPGAVEVTLMFCDLKNFTAYAEANGDGAALSTIEHFFDVIGHERGDDGDFVKSLGDGAMLAYDDPCAAVAAGMRVIAGMRSPGLPGVHVSVHRGVVMARSGDYFGGSVNLAARLLAFAGRDELLATADVVDACRDGFEWESAGERKLRGVAAPVAVYRLRLA